MLSDNDLSMDKRKLPEQCDGGDGGSPMRKSPRPTAAPRVSNRVQDIKKAIKAVINNGTKLEVQCLSAVIQHALPECQKKILSGSGVPKAALDNFERAIDPFRVEVPVERVVVVESVWLVSSDDDTAASATAGPAPPQSQDVGQGGADLQQLLKETEEQKRRLAERLDGGGL